jgi:hypothetical protein
VLLQQFSGVDARPLHQIDDASSKGDPPLPGISIVGYRIAIPVQDVQVEACSPVTGLLPHHPPDCYPHPLPIRCPH